jgi:hypothetical protein
MSKEEAPFSGEYVPLGKSPFDKFAFEETMTSILI